MRHPRLPINGVAIDWAHVTPAPEPEPLPPCCPHCQEEKLIDLAGREGFCNVCSKTFTLPKG